MGNLDKHLDQIQEGEVVNENFAVTMIMLFVGYVVLIVLIAMKVDYDRKKVKEIATKLYPKIKKDLAQFEKDLLPVVMKVGKKLYNTLTRMNYVNIEFVKVLVIGLGHNLDDVRLILKPIITERDHKKQIPTFIKLMLNSIIHSTRKGSPVVNHFNFLYFRTRFQMYFIDDSYESLPMLLKDRMSETHIQKTMNAIEYIINEADKDVQEFCDKFIEKVKKETRDIIEKEFID